MPGSIWKLIFSNSKKDTSQNRSNSSHTKVKRKTPRPLPIYTPTASPGEVVLPDNAEPNLYKPKTSRLPKLAINESDSAPPPEYEVYELSPASVRHSFQL